MTVVDGYTRVSGDPQEDNSSLDEQERCIIEYCRENGLTLGKIHREVYSGYFYRERKDLTLMRERYREGTIDGVVVRTLDRLSRSQVHAAVLLEEMEFYSVQLYSCKEVIDDTPMGKFIRMILAFVAEMEREKIMDRTLAGKVSRAKEGKVVSGMKAPYGWKYIYVQVGDKMKRDHVELDEEPVAVIRKCAQDYADGVSLYVIQEWLESNHIPAPGGKHWHTRSIRRILTDSRLTGQNVKVFTVKNKRAKQHLEPVEMPDGTFPRIISDELYEKIMERANTNSLNSVRNSRNPEWFLLRAGLVRCAYCKFVMVAKQYVVHGKEYSYYVCPNKRSECKHFTIPSEKLDTEVWDIVSILADHVPLLEHSVELAIRHHSVDDDLHAIELALEEWRAKVANFQDDLADSSLRGDTRAGIRNLLNNANEMVERLEHDKTELQVYSIDREQEREEFDKILTWCRKVKEDREELTYLQKRDFLRMIGATVLVEKLEQRGGPIKWDIKVSLPKIEEIIYQGRVGKIGDDLCNNIRRSTT